MQTIYEPSGAAREYAPLALNIYRGCSHNCAYCYVPAILRMAREDFLRVHARPGILRELPQAARRFQGDSRRVHLCFSCDPWPNPALFAADEPDYTGLALEILADYNLKVQTLTKAPLRAECNLRALKACDAHFGITLSWVDDDKRKKWEPGTDGETGLSVLERVEGLMMARDAGLYTWASVEPVIEPQEALDALEMLMPLVDEIKVGRWNHSVEANKINWKAFAVEVDRRLKAWGGKYLLKTGLAELLP